jgi:ArsR family transcriptional regulator
MISRTGVTVGFDMADAVLETTVTNAALAGKLRQRFTNLYHSTIRCPARPAPPVTGSPHRPSMTAPLIQDDAHIEQASRAMKAMSHPIRLKILCVLGETEVSVQDIVEAVGTSQSNVSQHLALMREKGVLRTRRDANRVYYRVSDLRTLQVIAMMRDVFCGFAQ